MEADPSLFYRKENARQEALERLEIEMPRHELKRQPGDTSAKGDLLPAAGNFDEVRQYKPQDGGEKAEAPFSMPHIMSFVFLYLHVEDIVIFFPGGLICKTSTFRLFFLSLSLHNKTQTSYLSFGLFEKQNPFLQQYPPTPFPPPLIPDPQKDNNKNAKKINTKIR